MIGLRKAGIVATALVGIGAGLTLTGVVAGNMSPGSASPQQATPTQVNIEVNGDSAPAFQRASALTGFDVRQPKYLPPGNQVSGISFLSDVNTHAFRVVHIGVRGTDGGFMLSETNTGFTAPTNAVALTQPDAKLQVWMEKGPDATVYTALSADHRGYTITILPGSSLAEADVLRILDATAAP